MKVPEGWRETRLGTLGAITRGVSYAPEDLASSDASDTVRLLRATNIQDGRILTEELQYVSERRCKDTQLLKPGDIAICMSSGSRSIVGKNAPYRLDDGYRYVVGAFCSVYRPRRLDTGRFIGQYFQSDEYTKALWTRTAGTNINNLRAEDVESIVLPLPPLPEQRRIAEILGAWDEAIALVERRLAAARERKRGLAQRLLTGQVRFPGFTEPWREVRLGEVANIHYGKSPNGVRSDGGAYPIYGTGGIVGKATDALCKVPAVILGRKGSIGNLFLASGPFWAIDTTFFAVPRHGVDIHWLFDALARLDLVRYNEASGVPSLSRPTLERVRMSLPPTPEQSRIAQVLLGCDTETSTLEAKLMALQAQKRGLMQRLLTGQVRV